MKFKKIQRITLPPEPHRTGVGLMGDRLGVNLRRTQRYNTIFFFNRFSALRQKKNIQSNKYEINSFFIVH